MRLKTPFFMIDLYHVDPNSISSIIQNKYIEGHLDRIPEGSILASSYLSDPYGIRGVSGIRDLSDGNNVLNYVDPLTEFYRAGVDGASGISNYLAHNSEDSVYSYLNEKDHKWISDYLSKKNK